MRPGFPAFDLCCDHGYLGIGALLSDRVPHVTFVDQVPAVIDRLSDRFPVHLDRTRATFIVKDAATLAVGKVPGTIVIAGVGATVAGDILRGFALPALDIGARVLVQPESRAHEIVAPLHAAGLRVQTREVVDNGIAHALVFAEKTE